MKQSTQMGKVIAFEQKVAKLFGLKFGIMTNSGTSALMIGIEALNLPEGSEVVTPL